MSSSAPPTKAPEYVRSGSMVIEQADGLGWYFVQPGEPLFSTAVMAAQYFVAEGGEIKAIFDDA